MGGQRGSGQSQCADVLQLWQGAAFANELRGCLLNAVALQSGRIDQMAHFHRRVFNRLLDWFAYGLMRALLWLTGKRY